MSSSQGEQEVLDIISDELTVIKASMISVPGNEFTSETINMLVDSYAMQMMIKNYDEIPSRVISKIAMKANKTSFKY